MAKLLLSGRVLGLALLLCFLPVGVTYSATPLRYGAWVVYWDFERGQERLAESHSLLSDVFFFSFELGPDASPRAAQPEAQVQAAVAPVRARGAAAWMTVVNDTRQQDGKAVLKDSNAVGRMLADAEARARHRRELVDMAVRNGFTGIDVDYENLQAADRDAFTTFVRELRGDTSARGLRLSVTVQPKRQESRSTGPGAADWAALCASTDRLQVMLYNLHNSQTPPGPVSEPGWAGEVMSYARQQCPGATLVPILKISAMDWGPKGMTELQHVDVRPLIARHSPRIEREPSGQTPNFQYDGSDGRHTVFFEDAESVATKVKALQQAGFDNVVLWNLGREDPELLARLASDAGVAAAPAAVPTPGPTPPPAAGGVSSLSESPDVQALGGSNFFYDFTSRGVLEEAGSMAASSSPYWWLNSGGRFYLDGVGETIQGALPAGDYWRLLYAGNNPLDTDNGTHPQNLFRLLTRAKIGAARQQVYFRIDRDNLSASPNRAASNGIFLMSRYSNSDNLYYAGVRVDGAAVIKKKIGGQYFTIAYKNVFAGAAYDRAKNPSLLPKNRWMGLTSETLNTTEGVRIRFHVNQGPAWALVFDVVDDGRYGGAPFRADGYTGLRTDFMDVSFDNYLTKPL